MSNKIVGSFGEKAAVDYIKSLGFKIIMTNYRIGRLGEIDIISEEEEYLCFTEVKTRHNKLYGNPSESITYRKRQKIIRLAQLYCLQQKFLNANIRFDVVEVYINIINIDPGNKDIELRDINLIRNAF